MLKQLAELRTPDVKHVRDRLSLLAKMFMLFTVSKVVEEKEAVSS